MDVFSKFTQHFLFVGNRTINNFNLAIEIYIRIFNRFSQLSSVILGSNRTILRITDENRIRA